MSLHHITTPFGGDLDDALERARAWVADQQASVCIDTDQTLRPCRACDRCRTIAAALEPPRPGQGRDVLDLIRDLIKASDDDRADAAELRSEVSYQQRLIESLRAERDDLRRRMERWRDEAEDADAAMLGGGR